MEKRQEIVILQCVFCKGSLHRLKVLPCLHSCCENCADALSLNSTTFRCPACNERIERSVFFSLPENLISRALQRNLECEMGSKEPSWCKICGDELAIADASTNSAGLCKMCIKMHAKVLELTFAKEHAAKEPLRSQHHRIPCKVHSGEDLRYLCRTCEEPICSECLIIEHKRHQLSKIEEHGNVYRTQLAMLETKLKEKTSSTKESLLQINDLKECVTLNHSNARHSVENYVQSCKERLDLIQSRVLEDIETEAYRKSLDLGEQGKTLLQMVNKFETALVFTDSLLKHANDTEVAIVKKHVVSRLRELDDIDAVTSPKVDSSFSSVADLQQRVESLLFDHLLQGKKPLF